MCQKPQEDNTREKTWNGTLQRYECDNKEVCEFSLLLKNPNRKEKTTFKPMEEEDWIREVKRVKKTSTS